MPVVRVVQGQFWVGGSKKEGRMGQVEVWQKVWPREGVEPG